MDSYTDLYLKIPVFSKIRFQGVGDKIIKDNGLRQYHLRLR